MEAIRPLSAEFGHVTQATPTYAHFMVRTQ